MFSPWSPTPARARTSSPAMPWPLFCCQGCSRQTGPARDEEEEIRQRTPFLRSGGSFS